MGTATKWLEGITRKASRRPAAMVILGQPGVGKTSIGAHVPAALMMPFKQENSYDLLKSSGAIPSDVPVLPPVESWLAALEVFEELKTQEHGHKALVIDTLSCLEALCHEYVCNKEFAGDWGDKGFQAYHRGYEISCAEWKEMLKALDDLRDDKGMTILFLEHVQIRPFKNPEGSDYDRYQAACHHKTWQPTHRWAASVMFYNYYVEVQEDGSRAKGKGGKSRVLYTQWDASHDAKDRFGLPREIDGGASGEEAWANLTEAILEAREE